MRIVVLGAGVSGVAAARVLMKFGHEVVVLERAGTIGGVWARAYPEVRLQNVAEHYRLSDFPWPFTPDLHPTASQIMRYLRAVVDHYGIQVRLNHEVIAMRDQQDGWLVEQRSPDGTRTELFDFVVVAAGHYTQEKPELPLPGRERFTGAVLTERDIGDLDVLAGKRVAVVGFGKTAVDIAAFAAERSATVHHVFREPRWLVPKYMLGVHATKLILARMSTGMLPSWVHLSAVERALHERMEPAVWAFWQMITLLVRMQSGLHGLWRDPEVRRRMRLLVPEQPFTYQMRAATALAPESYYPSVMKGQILPYRAEVKGLSESALLLTDGRRIECDVVIVAVGHKTPSFPFFPERYRRLLESEPDGAQLYRHLLHPRVPKVAFAGFNHSFLHFAGVEIAMIWLCAYLSGDLRLPAIRDMERSIEHVRDWKRANSLFEPSRAYGVNTRFHQYLDVMLADLGVSPYRKKSVVAELLSAYSAEDYRGIFEDYERARARRTAPRETVPLRT